MVGARLHFARQFPKYEPVNRQLRIAKAFFESRRHEWRLIADRSLKKIGLGSDRLAYGTKIICLIGRDLHRSAGAERSMQRLEKGFVHQPAILVASFRPGVRKHHVKNVDRTRRQQLTHRMSRFDAKHSRVRETPLRQFVARASDPAEKTLDPKKISFRIRGGELGEVCAIATSEIYLERSDSLEDGSAVEGMKIVVGDQLRRRSGFLQSMNTAHCS